jgi:hypothetical protein
MKFLKEPLFHFLLIGMALFLIYGWKNNFAFVPGGAAGTPTAQITVTPDDVAQMNNLFERTWQRPPTEEEQKGLLEDFVRNEIFYREAIAIGLDRNDEVLKRRLRQKMEFIYEDISSLTEPTDEELTTFMEKNRTKYFTDTEIAFRQVYINVSRRGTNAESDARQILDQLTAGTRPDSVGDPTQLEAEMPLTPVSEIGKMFGAEFSETLLTLEEGKWRGPIRSGFGLHLVSVREHADGHLPELSEIRETVRQHWMIARQKEMKDAAYAKIRERYTVTVEHPERASESLSSVAEKKVAKK